MRSWQPSKPEPEKKPPAVIYARFSPRPSGGPAPKSCETQVSICRDWCRAQEMEVLDQFQDEYSSGSTLGNRPGFDDAMRMACAKKAVLVVYDLSRFARNTRDAMNCASALDEAGAHLASVKDNIDTSSPMGRCFFTIISAINQLERERCSARTRDSMMELQRKGWRMSGVAPYGWRIDPENPKRLVKNEQEQKVARIIEELREDGMKWTHIGEKLLAMGHKPRGKKWRWDLLVAIFRRRKFGV